MRKTMMKRLRAFILTTMMLAATCIAFGNPGGMFAMNASAAETESQYTLDMTASINEEDSSIIDVVITAKGFKQELLSSEFFLNFDSTKVEGVLTTYEEMDAFMTKTPTYIFTYGGVEVPVPSFEQICYYDLQNSRYECRFVDLLEYPYAKEGQAVKGLVNDGDLVITVQFKILEGVAPGTKIEFSLTNVLGTTNLTDGLNIVPGTGDTASVTIPVDAYADAAYTLDVTASINPEDSSIIDVVITAKNFKQELVASEFMLNFDSTKVEGILTTSEEMDAFMTKTPTYIFSYGGIETTVPSFEQICYYNSSNSRYDCKFCDLLDYPHAKNGQEIKGLTNDGDLVITVPFKILDGVAPGTEIEFSVTHVKGTTNIADGLNGVSGAGDTAVVKTPTAPVSKKFDITLANLTLGNDLTLYFYIPADGCADWTGTYAVITKPYANGKPAATVTVPFESWESGFRSGGKDLYRVAFNGIAAKEMADEVTIQIFNAEGKAISNVGTESVRSYLDRFMKANATDAVKMRLAVDMLNYGAAAQTHFGYNTANLANAGLTAAQKAFGTATAPACVNGNVKGANAKGSNLTLESSILMNFYFNGLTEDMYAVVTFTDHTGKAHNEKLDAHDGSRFTVNQVVVADARQLITVTVYNADGSVYGTCTDSVESYLSRARAAQANGLALYEAIMKFADSAYEYLHNR